jgi:diguanylate cyclase (GGDEF)-like protein
MILLHFAAFMFLAAPAFWGSLATFFGLAALANAGLLFKWAAVPFRTEPTSRWMFAALSGINTLYIGILTLTSAPHWAVNSAAALMGILPLATALITIRRFSHPLRWVTVLLYGALSVFLLIIQNRPKDGADLALNAVMFTVFFGCCINFLVMYRRATSGALVTIFGFLAWAAVFVVAPGMGAFFPNVHLESEVWNLPKYVVAVGMILLVLEDQIEHNKFLALHDELTGLPNRRLFQDRLTSALERARRSGAETALLLVDLDNFKHVNDSLGHHVGDLLLQRVASLFADRVRRSDTVARTGGDEFCLILEEPTSRAEAGHVADSIMKLLDEPAILGQNAVRVGASIGIAIFPEDAADSEALCIAADLRMYAMKHEGRRLNEPSILNVQVDFAAGRKLSPLLWKENAGGAENAPKPNPEFP